MYTELSGCRICGNDELIPVLDLGHQALTGVFPKAGQNVEEGPLELVKCREDGPDACGLVQLRHSFTSETMYGQNYGYRSGLNASMVAHLRELAAKASTHAELQSGDTVLDIGSNDSTLLQSFAQPGLKLVGMDPTGSKFRSFYPPHIQLIPDFFSADRFLREVGGQPVKLITSIAMFYDLASPLDFMREIHRLLADDGVWIFEQSYLPLMLETTSYDTICHEHLAYYAFKQIVWMTERAGFTILDVELNGTNGGSFAVTVGKEGGRAANQSVIDATLEREQRLGLASRRIYVEFRDRVYRHRTSMRDMLSRFAGERKKVLGYGASTKGNVMLQFCSITPDDLPVIADVNPDKFGCFTPGTLIPIIPEAEAHALAPDCFVVLPWHFRDNIVERESAFLKRGGRLLFPFPDFELVGANKDVHAAEYA
jgi:C-methyltransferase-like protein/putative zinc binding protein/methyltransferase family protein